VCFESGDDVEKFIEAPVQLSLKAIRQKRGGVRERPIVVEAPIISPYNCGVEAVGRSRRSLVFAIEFSVPVAETIKVPVPTAVVQLRRGRS